jgi:hypothetical protein
LAFEHGQCARSCGYPQSVCCRNGTCHWGYPVCPYGALMTGAGDGSAEATSAEAGDASAD